MVDSRVSFGRVVLLLGVVVAAVGFVTIATGSPQPSPLCDVCGDEFEQRAAHEGYSISVDESRLRIEFAPDGGSQWTIYNRLDNPISEQFPANQDRLTQFVDEHVHPYAKQVTTERHSKRVIKIQYERSGGTSTHPGDVMVVQGFDNVAGHTTDGHETIIEGPPNTVVWTEISDFSVDDRNITVPPNASISWPNYVVFAPDSGLFTSVFVYVGLLSSMSDRIVYNSLLWGLIPSIGFGLFVMALQRTVISNREFTVDRTQLGVASVAVGTGIVMLWLVASRDIAWASSSFLYQLTAIFGVFRPVVPLFGLFYLVVGALSVSRPATLSRLCDAAPSLVVGGFVGSSWLMIESGLFEISPSILTPAGIFTSVGVAIWAAPAAIILLWGARSETSAVPMPIVATGCFLFCLLGSGSIRSQIDPFVVYATILLTVFGIAFACGSVPLYLLGRAASTASRDADKQPVVSES